MRTEFSWLSRHLGPATLSCAFIGIPLIGWVLCREREAETRHVVTDRCPIRCLERRTTYLRSVKRISTAIAALLLGHLERPNSLVAPLRCLHLCALSRSGK
jgi:hypothetical protein